MGVCFKGYVDIAQILIERGSNLNAQHGNGGTALMFVAMFGRNEIVNLLLEQGADSSIKDMRGLSALDLAAQQGILKQCKNFKKNSTIDIFVLSKFADNKTQTEWLKTLGI